MTRAAHAVATTTKQAAGDCGQDARRLARTAYDVGNERVIRKGGGRGMTFAQAAQKAIELGGIYDGHEVPRRRQRFTKSP